MDILEKLKAGSRNVKNIMWPGTDTAIAIRVLTEQDYHDASLAVDRIYRDAEVRISMENISDYEAEKNVQLLFRAIVDPDSNQPICKSIIEFRKLLTKDIRNYLITELTAFEKECSPNLETMSDSEFSSLLIQVKKNAETTITSDLSLSTLKKLVVTLAEQLANLQVVNGSSLQQ